MRIIDFLKSEQGQDFKLVLEVSVSLLLFFWMLKNHKIIKT
tara:strand:+ start:2816 stop:2938 length:123 start_codon:yes stop_codon:yes gene_type:complete